jgi:hypothetical protein
MTQSEQVKIIYNVISSNRKKTEASFNASEHGNGEKGKCHVCGRAGHKMKKCWYYDPTKTLEENKKQPNRK